MPSFLYCPPSSGRVSQLAQLYLSIIEGHNLAWHAAEAISIFNRATCAVWGLSTPAPYLDNK